MRKLLLLCILISFFSCEKNETIDVLPDVHVNITINLNDPQYVHLQFSSESAYTTGGNDGIQGILIRNTGSASNPFKAFERACPNFDCSSPMKFDGSLKMKCDCDGSEYSILDGSPQTEGNSHFAREYRVRVSGSTLNITNF